MNTFSQHSNHISVKTFFILMMILCSYSMIYSQENNWQITFKNGTKISEIKIDSLSESSLAIQKLGYPELFEVESITEIRKVNDPNLLFWIGGGFIIGVAIPLVWVLIESRGGYTAEGAIIGTGAGLALGLLFGLLGWGIAAIAYSDDVYDLSGLPLDGKLTLIATIPLE